MLVDNKETILKSILVRFNRDDKEVLAKELIMRLNLESEGTPYQLQVSNLLGRELTSDEVFKLSILNRVHNYITGAAGCDDDEE